MPLLDTESPAEPPLGAAPDSARRGASVPLAILETMRPKQWSKNAFVFAGLLFSGEVVHLDAVVPALVVAAAFCLVSGATYLLNDAVDAEADRHNPRTASRPIARGDLSPGLAIAAASLAALAGAALAAAINWESLVTLLGYVVLQIAYSNWLKHMLFVDVMAIAAGFVLRAVAGGVAIGVPVSSWLLLCTGLLALFLGLTKRRGEAVALGGTERSKRAVIESYSVGLLDELIAVVTPTTVVAYALYAVTGAATDLMLLTVPFVMYGIFRVLFLIHHRGSVTDEPAVVVWRDRPLLLCVVLWAICAGSIVAATGAVPDPG